MKIKSIQKKDKFDPRMVFLGQGNYNDNISKTISTQVRIHDSNSNKTLRCHCSNNSCDWNGFNSCYLSSSDYYSNIYVTWFGRFSSEQYHLSLYGIFKIMKNRSMINIHHGRKGLKYLNSSDKETKNS